MTNMTPEGKLLNVIKEARGRLRLKKDLKIFTKINIVLIGLTIVILAVFLADLFTSDYKRSELIVELPKDEVEVLPVVEYIEEGPVIDKKAIASKGELIKDLAVLGIIKGENDQVILEDKNANKTFFLYEGDSAGEFKVEEIKDSGVILDYRGEKVELNI